jgi:hypothetical protein
MLMTAQMRLMVDLQWAWTVVAANNKHARSFILNHSFFRLKIRSFKARHVGPSHRIYKPLLLLEQYDISKS